MAKEVDEIVGLLVPEEFYGVGSFYKNFREVSDDEVSSILRNLDN